MSIRTKAILFFGALLLSIVFVDVFYMEYGVRKTFTSKTINDFRIIAEQSESTFLAFSRQMETRTLDWSLDSYLRTTTKEILNTEVGSQRNLEAIQKFSTYFLQQKMPFAEDVLIADILNENGTVVASTEKERIGVNYIVNEAIREKQQFSNVVNSDIGSVFLASGLSRDTNSEVLSRAAVRIFDLDSAINPSPLGAVLVLHFSNIQYIVDALNGDEGAQTERLTSKALLDTYTTSKIFLLTSNGISITPSQENVSEVYRPGLLSFPQNVCFKDGGEVYQEYINAEGVYVVGASMCLEEQNLVLVIEIDKNEIFAPLNILIQWTILGVVLLFFLGATVVMFFVRLPLVRINEIIKALEKVMKGNLDVSVYTNTDDETGRLARMFNTMIGSIRKNNQKLKESKRQLEEKTTLLEEDLIEHEKQEKFLEESKRATLNLLEDSWKAKEKLEEEGTKLQTVLSSIGDGLILVDNEYKIILINKKALELFKMPNENLVGKGLYDVIKLYKNNKELSQDEVPSKSVILTKKAITTTIEEKYSISTKNLVPPLPVAFSIAPIVGKFSGVVIVFRDVTADREFDEAKTGFISVASHQLRTPLTSIRWYSEMLLSDDVGELNDSQREFVNEVHSGVERLYKTVDMLLGLSRVESGKIKIEKTPINIETLSRDIMKELISQAQDKKLSISIEPPPGEPVVVWLDSLLLRQVLLNLFSNAISYSKENGVIKETWNYSKDNSEVVCSVNDNGIGIPESQRGRIFSKFFRAENARQSVPDGSGLGLALVKKLVESWGGRIWFESKEDVGTTFFFSIPLVTPVDQKKQNTLSVREDNNREPENT